MEIMDLYDDNFNKLNKTVVRRVDEIPEGANIMASYALIKNNNKYLLEQFTQRNDFKYGLPGGHLLTTENGEQGLRRELKEELNLQNIEIKHLDTVKYPYSHYIFNVYLIEQEINISDLSFQPEEVISIGWFSKDEIRRLIEEDKIPRGYAYILDKYM